MVERAWRGQAATRLTSPEMVPAGAGTLSSAPALLEALQSCSDTWLLCYWHVTQHVTGTEVVLEQLVQHTRNIDLPGLSDM